MLPGVLPPTSAWWARLAANPMWRVAGEERRDERDVGQVRPAAVGVVQDPGVARRAGPPSCTAATASGIAPRWTGMCSACITISPRASNSAVEASRRSLMLAEWAARTSAAPISSHTARSAPGEHLQRDRVERSPTPALQHERPVAVGRSPTTRAGRPTVASGQLADRRALDLLAGGEARPVRTAVSSRSAPKRRRAARRAALGRGVRRTAGRRRFARRRRRPAR